MMKLKNLTKQHNFPGSEWYGKLTDNSLITIKFRRDTLSIYYGTSPLDLSLQIKNDNPLYEYKDFRGFKNSYMTYEQLKTITSNKLDYSECKYQTSFAEIQGYYINCFKELNFTTKE